MSNTAFLVGNTLSSPAEQAVQTQGNYIQNQGLQLLNLHNVVSIKNADFLEMGTNHRFGSLCQFVFQLNRCSAVPSSASSDRHPLRGSAWRRWGREAASEWASAGGGRAQKSAGGGRAGKHQISARLKNKPAQTAEQAVCAQVYEGKVKRQW